MTTPQNCSFVASTQKLLSTLLQYKICSYKLKQFRLFQKCLIQRNVIILNPCTDVSNVYTLQLSMLGLPGEPFNDLRYFIFIICAFRGLLTAQIVH